MANFDSGVSKYIKTCAVVEVGFPVDWNGRPDISCKHCKFFIPTTRKCGLNQEVVNFPEKYVGEFCPLELIEEEVNENV